jgi:hypothetical protein
MLSLTCLGSGLDYFATPAGTKLFVCFDRVCGNHKNRNCALSHQRNIFNMGTMPMNSEVPNCYCFFQLHHIQSWERVFRNRNKCSKTDYPALQGINTYSIMSFRPRSLQSSWVVGHQKKDEECLQFLWLRIGYPPFVPVCLFANILFSRRIPQRDRL